MEDIRLAVGLIGFISVAAFAVTFRLLRSRSSLFLDLIAVFIVGLTIAYVLLVWGQLWIVQWIPLPSVIILSNWFPILMSSLAAAVWLRLEPASIARRMPIMAVLLAASTFSLTYFIPRKPPECGDKWVRPVPPLTLPVCLQTTRYTCSAAAAATLLKTIGVDSSEQEMATLCLTRSGTTWLGLYHGLATKVMGTPYHVEFFDSDLSGIEDMAQGRPVLLCCELDPAIAEMVPSYVTEGGWIPGTAHSVVYFGMIRGVHVIGDPSRGFEVWRPRDLNALWTGTGLRFAENEAPEG